jgi:hypothetical protein
LTFTLSITRRCPVVNYRRLAPSVVVDDFALNPDIDFAIACFEDLYGGAL